MGIKGAMYGKTEAGKFFCGNVPATNTGKNDSRGGSIA